VAGRSDLACLLVALAVSGIAAPATADDVAKLQDPSGDDNGPGGYIYPTDPVYAKGSFDLRQLTVSTDGDNVEIRIRVGAKVADPWRSKEWDGNGFSLQMAFVFFDTDGKPGSGHTEGLPGLNVAFDPAGAWDKVVLISPQSAKRLHSEIEQKAKALQADIVIPERTRARGKELISVVSAKALGGKPTAAWGYQVVLQSNEGYPGSTDLLTRKVNEYEGPHRFGGGNDHECDPHAIDILAPPAKGEDSERAAQHKILGAHVCNADGTGKHAVLPMVVPAKLK
jgi:carbohydrate-binding DOMON domain-containing protein